MSRLRALRPAWPYAWVLLTVLLPSSPRAQSAETGWSTGLTVEQLDLQSRSAGSTLAWDLTGHARTGHWSAWLRGDGESEADGQVNSRVELLWGHSFVGPTDLLIGVRHDSGTLASRSYAALGLQSEGGGPLLWDVTGYLGEGSSRADVHVGTRLQARYQWPLAQHWSLRARTELEYWNEDHERFVGGTGSGPCELRAGLHLGYGSDRRLDYYIGGEWLYQLQDTAELTEKAGGDARYLNLVAGLRLAF